MNIEILKIRLYGDPCLRRKSTPVADTGHSLRVLIRSMIATMHENKGIGLAAPQVGVNERFFVVDIGDGPLVFINPKIIRKSGSSVLEEGCLSIPGVTVTVRRPEKIVVRYWSEDHGLMEKSYGELMARVILHETDHLDGKLIVDYAGLREKIKLRRPLKEIQARRRKENTLPR